MKSRLNIKRNIRLAATLVLLTMGIHGIQAQSDSLSLYLNIAAENNPLLKSQFLGYKASLEKIPQAGAFEDPQLEMGFFLKPMNLLGGKQVADFKLMQMFPWFGTRKAARNEAAEMARMRYEEFRETRDNLFFEVKTTWHNLLNQNQQLTNTRENKALLVILKELAVNRFSAPSFSSQGNSATRKTIPQTIVSPTPQSSGMGAMNGMGGSPSAAQQSSQGASMQGMSQGSGMGGGMKAAQGGMSEVLRIQMELNELENQEELLLSTIVATKAKFNALLGRSSETDFELPATISKLHFLWDDKTIAQTIVAQNPMLMMATAEEAAYKAKEVMDKRMGLPMIGIGLQYSLIGKRDGSMIPVMESMNGKDMIMPMISFSIPIWRKKYKSAQKESRYMAGAAKEKYRDALNNLSAEQRSVKQQLFDAERLIKLYTGQEELAETTYNLAVKEFVSGTGSLTNVLDVERQLLDYKLKRSEAIATYNTVVAMIENLLSEPQDN